MVSRKQWIVIGCIGLFAVFSCNGPSNEQGTETIGSDQKASGKAFAKTIWKLYKPNNGRFEVLLPSLPQHVSEAHPNGNDFTKYDVYLSQDHGGGVFMLSMTEYPNTYEMGSIDEVLEAVKNGALGANSKNSLKSSERTTFLNLPALDFSIENNEFAIRSKVIVTGNVLFVLTVMDRDPHKLDSDFNTFTGSLVIKNPPKAEEKN